MALVALTTEEIQDALEVHHELNNPHVTRLLDIQREEVVQRVLLATYWENDRVAEERNMGTLPDPGTDFHSAFQRDKEKLLESSKYEGLITRGFLKEERWLEFTYIRLGDLCQEEKVFRACVEAEEQQRACSLTVQQLRLAALTVHGTEGSVVRIEELEREVRYRVLSFEEVVVREVLLSECEVSHQAAQVRERKRMERYRQAHVEIRDEEIPARWDIEGAEMPGRTAIEKAKAHADRTIFGQVEWRMINLEVNTRYEIEYAERDQVSEQIYEHPDYLRLMEILEAAPPAPVSPIATPVEEAGPNPDDDGLGDDVSRSVLKMAVEMDEQCRLYSPDRWTRTVQDALTRDEDGAAVPNYRAAAIAAAGAQPSIDSEIPSGKGDSTVAGSSVAAGTPTGEGGAAVADEARAAVFDGAESEDGGPAPNAQELEALWKALND